MNCAVNTFTISLPVNDEVFNVVLLLFHAQPGSHGKKACTYSIVGRVTGPGILFLKATINARYAKNAVLTDSPVIKNGEFIFSNQGHTPAFFRMSLMLKAEDRNGRRISAVFLIDLQYTILRFMVTGIRLRRTIKDKQSSGEKTINYAAH